MRWLAHRGGALDFRDHRGGPGRAVSGASCSARTRDDPRRGDPGARFAVRVPVRRSATRLAHRDRQCLTHASTCRPRRDRARGHIRPDAADPTGYETRRGRSAITRLLQRGRALPRADDRAHHDATHPIYHSTYTGKPPTNRRCSGRAERSVRAAAAEAIPEIADFYLPRRAVVIGLPLSR